jgi:hypothetical protein
LVYLVEHSVAYNGEVRATEEVDSFLLAVPDAPNLDHNSHWYGHLDQIEQTLAKQPKADGNQSRVVGSL